MERIFLQQIYLYPVRRQPDVDYRGIYYYIIN